MQPFVSNAAALAVALLFYWWRAYAHTLQIRRRMLCERVAFMLWIVAERIKGDSGASTNVARLTGQGL